MKPTCVLIAALLAAGTGAGTGVASESATALTTTRQSSARAPNGSDPAHRCYRARRLAGLDALGSIGSTASLGLATPGFIDSTAALGLTAPLQGQYGHATAAGDVDGDGWTDLFFGGFADKARGGRAPDRLLRGGPDRFRADHSFEVEPGRTSGAAFADLDGDGDLDLVLSRNYRDHEGGRGPSIVLRNDEAHFVQAGVLDDRRGGRSIGVLDYDGDGRLDLFLVEDRFSGGSSALFHNDGGLRFTDTTSQAGLPLDVAGLGVAAVDLTGDGWTDLFVSDSNRIFVNQGDGSFREARSSVFGWKRFGAEDDAAGVAAGDLNRDGRDDLVVGQHYNSTVDGQRRVPVRLYLNEGTRRDGAPRFRDATHVSGLVPLPTKAPHVEIADLDDDGWPDILTTASAANGARPAVFRNLGVELGSPRFQPPEGLGAKQYWIAGATLDADHDGDLDVFLVEFARRRSSLLLRTVGTRGHWVGVQVGRSGAGGIGTSVRVYRAGALGDPSQLLGSRTVVASSGFGSGALPAAYFGLGTEAEVDVLVIAPRAEPVVLRRLAADQLVEVAADAQCRD